MKFKILLVLTLVFGLGFVACEKEDGEEGEGGNEQMTSKFNDDESHNASINCMNCHLQGGEGEGWFTVGGTVYQENKTTVYPNATVTLSTEPNGGGTLIKSIEVDGKGNFYTTDDIPFGDGIYVSVAGNSETKSMMGKITTGACNSCHSNTDMRIWTK